jgi:membrane fusion protein (multidrug efflux system)
VETYTTELLTVPVISDYVGQTEASQQVDVRARVEGVVWEIGFEEGTSVTAGQFLFRIDPRPFEADMQIAEAKTYQAKVAVQSAERDLNRTRRLQESASVSREELDNATSAYETAVADMRLAEANLMKARLELSYTTVTASIAGMVGKALKKPGDLVDAGQNSLLCNITAQNPMFVTFNVSEKDLLEQRNAEQAGRIIAPADDDYEVEITLLDGSRYPFSGHINFADVKIDPQTGTGLVRAAFPNDKGLLKPGQFVKVHVKGARRTNTVMVPQTAVMIGMQGTYVYVVDDAGKVEMRPVKATDWEGRNWIIESGLVGGERVIINGTNKTQPGAEVKVTTETQTLDLRILNTAAHDKTTSSAAAGRTKPVDQTLPKEPTHTKTTGTAAH